MFFSQNSRFVRSSSTMYFDVILTCSKDFTIRQMMITAHSHFTHMLPCTSYNLFF